MHRIPMVALLAVTLAACSEPPPDVAATPAAGSAAVTSPAPVEPIDALASIVVSTNEPFLQARIDGDMLLLTGVDVGERLLTVEELANRGDTRIIVARDAGGSVAVQVRRQPCQDSMSGASFPLGALLTVDGDGPHPGCARPASMPAPAPSPD